MSPEALAAADRLAALGRVTPATADHLRRVARDELVSVRAELRLFVYGGVLVVMAGVGLLIREHFARLGPLAVIAGLTTAAAVVLAWVVRHAPPFSWAEAGSSHPAFEYMVVLVVLLAGADLACVEMEFTPLGPAWPWHLLIVSLLAGAAAFRYDSRVVLSLALSTFAAWRGVSVSLVGRAALPWATASGPLRANAVACGVAFLVLGTVLLRRDLKPHFEPVAVHLGWLLVLAALLGGAGEDRSGVAWTLALLVTGAGLAGLSIAQRRFWLFAMGLLGAYLALTILIFRWGHDDGFQFSWVFLTAIGILATLLVVHGRMKEPA